jgi:hypothetical protein
MQPVCDFLIIPTDQHIRSSDQTKSYHMLRGRHGHDGMVVKKSQTGCIFI